MTFYKVVAGAKPTGTQWNATVLESLKLGSLNLIRELIDREVDFSADGTDFYGEVYTDADGRLNSVDTVNTTATFDTDKYKVNSNLVDGVEITNYNSSITDNTSGSLDYGVIVYIKENIKITSITKDSYNNAPTCYIYDSDKILLDSSSFSGDTATFDLTLSKGNKIFILTGDNAGGNYNVKEGKNPESNFGTTVDFVYGAYRDYSSGTISEYNFSNNIKSIITEKVNSEDSLIKHIIPINTFPNNISSSYIKALFKDYEEGADIKFKLLSDNFVTTGTTYNDGASNPTNAFDGDLSTYSSIQNASLGKTFSSTTIYKIKLRAYGNNGFGGVIRFEIITYDGTDWTTRYSFTLLDEKVTSTIIDLEGITCEGVALKSIGSVSPKLYEFSYSTSLSQDSGWLDEDELNTFTAFTSEPTTCIVKLIPKTTSPTAGYPSIKGVAYRGTD